MYMCRIGVVLVTYNRLEKLKNALTAYKLQSVKPSYILVVNNHSSDGTTEFLVGWEQESESHFVLNLPSNVGGSGGFYEGFRMALTLDADWILVADDDAYPEQRCLEHMKHFIIKADSSIVSLCASVITDDKIDTWHRRRLKKRFGILYEERISISEYNQPFELTFFSYVGSLIQKDVLTKAGLPNKDFFIAYDDSEHSYRISKYGKIVCLPDAKILHDTIESDGHLTWKKYYAVRNKLYSYRQHFSFVQVFVLEAYYFFKYIKSVSEIKLVIASINDARHKKLGKHSVYKPGWKEA